MILSMTGFGRAVKQMPNKKLTIEIKTLNSKQLDLNVRVPSFYRSKELDIRSLIAKAVQRGKVEFNLYAEITGSETPYSVNSGIIEGYINALKSIYNNAPEQDYLAMAVRFPDALKPEREELSDEEWNEVAVLIKLAVAELVNYREKEGESLSRELNLRIDNIEKLLAEIVKYESERIAALRERISKNIEELKINVDENRFEQEMIFYIEKLDITEEKVRLEHHLDYFRNVLDSDESNGKKLGFISQEIGREINTMGSKSNHSQMQKIVVQMKDELEKIKEQVLNVL